MRTPQGSEHTTCAKVVEARAVRLTGAVSIDRRKAGLRRRIEAVSDPAVFGHAFRNNESWQAWFAFLAALFGLPLTPEQLSIYQPCTGRKMPPVTRAVGGWLVCGRRAGKSFILALTAVFLSAFFDWRPHLGPG